MSQRKRGRPVGLKEKHKRKRRERRVIPPELKWLSLDEAVDDCGLSRSLLVQHYDDIGARKVGNRIVIERERLDAWLRSRPVPVHTGRITHRDERVAAD